MRGVGNELSMTVVASGGRGGGEEHWGVHHVGGFGGLEREGGMGCGDVWCAFWGGGRDADE